MSEETESKNSPPGASKPEAETTQPSALKRPPKRQVCWHRVPFSPRGEAQLKELGKASGLSPGGVAAVLVERAVEQKFLRIAAALEQCHRDRTETLNAVIKPEAK